MFKLVCSIDNDAHNLLENAIRSKNKYLVLISLKSITNTFEAERIKLLDCLIDAIKETRVDIMFLLLDKLQNMQMITSSSIEKLMQVSILYKRTVIIRYLLLIDRSFCNLPINGKSLLEYMIRYNYVEMVQLLVDHYGVNVKNPGSDGYDLIFVALKHNNAKISEILLHGGTDVHCRDEHGNFLIEVCIQKRWYLHVKHIIRSGFGVFYDDHALFCKYCHLAVNNKCTLIFDFLVKNYFAVKIQRYWRAKMNV
jgi:hypothetical protein